MTNGDRREQVVVGRRAALAKLAAVGTMAYFSPVLVQLSRAQESSSGPSSSNSSDSSSSRRASSSAPSAPEPRRAPQQQSSFSEPARRPAPPPRLELVVAVGSNRDVERLRDAGFEVMGFEPVALVGRILTRLRLRSGQSVAQAQSEIRRLLPRASTVANDVYRTSELPCTDGSCEGFSMIGWNRPPCQLAPRIGMVDAGINTDHDAFVGQSLEVVSVDVGERQRAGATHGTAVASLLIGSERSRTPGLLPRAELVAVDAFYQDASGDAADVYSLVRALDLLAERHVQVINLSLAGPANDLLDTAISALAVRDIAVVAAAGNGGPMAEPQYPAAHPSVIAVTAVGRESDIYRQANAGPHISFAAPGVQVWTAASVSGGRFRSGTSYAAPFVTASIAVARLRYPGATVPSIVSDLAESALDLGDPGRDATFGWGLVQADGLCIAGPR